MAKEPFTGEITLLAVKPLRRECRMFSAALYARVRTFCAHCTRDRGCSAHPAFPAPSVFGGRENYLQISGASCRENAKLYPPSLRANGSRECAPDDRLREAIHVAAQRKNGLLRRKRSSQ